MSNRIKFTDATKSSLVKTGKTNITVPLVREFPQSYCSTNLLNELRGQSCPSRDDIDLTTLFRPLLAVIIKTLKNAIVYAQFSKGRHVEYKLMVRREGRINLAYVYLEIIFWSLDSSELSVQSP